MAGLTFNNTKVDPSTLPRRRDDRLSRPISRTASRSARSPASAWPMAKTLSGAKAVTFRDALFEAIISRPLPTTASPSRARRTATGAAPSASIAD